jgi:phosphoribosylformylglycinamidine cyclo-ligase
MLTYEKAGVSVSTGNALVGKIKTMTKGLRPAEGGSRLGGFASVASLPSHYKNPQIVTATDGVGTKILLCKETQTYDTVGIDLVAMSVNDILTVGAEPYLFLDYYATSKLELETAQAVLKGIVKGCKQANCALVGGETAEMPQVYRPGDFDLAGFCIGVLEKGQALDGSAVQPNDVLIGLPSSGLHSNGFSLARAALRKSKLTYQDPVDFAKGKTWGQLLLTPTKIYVKDVLPWVQKKKIKAMAHITGGGFQENLVRVLPEGVQAVVDHQQWRVPKVFSALAQAGHIATDEMYRTFNMGIGMVLVVGPADASLILKSIRGSRAIGVVEKGGRGVRWKSAL